MAKAVSSFAVLLCFARFCVYGVNCTRTLEYRARNIESIPSDIDESFDRDSSILDHLRCTSISNITLDGWTLLNSDKYSSVYRTKEESHDTIRVCIEFCGISPKAIFDLTTNYETRQGYDRIMEVKKVKDLSDSVSVVHSEIKLRMGLVTRELWQYQKILIDETNEEYKVLYQDVLDVDIAVTQGMIRANVPISDYLIEPHSNQISSDCDPDSNSTMLTLVSEIQPHGAIPKLAMRYMETIFPREWKLELETYYQLVYIYSIGK